MMGAEVMTTTMVVARIARLPVCVPDAPTTVRRVSHRKSGARDVLRGANALGA